MDLFFNTALAFAIGSILGTAFGYYIGHRGLQGVQNDVNDIRTEIAHIKGVMTGNAQATAPATV